MNGYRRQQQALVAQIRASLKGKPSASELSSASTVAMRQDYEADNRLCLTSLAFLSKELAERIEHEILEPLRTISPEHYFIPTEALHLTIKNIRIVSTSFDEKTRQQAGQVFAEVIPKHSTFEVSFEDLLVLPTSLVVVGYTTESLGTLVTALDQALKDAGIPDDKHYYSNSVFFVTVTLCRFTQGPSEAFRAAIDNLRATEFGSMTVRSVHLVGCNAVCGRQSRQIFATYRLKTP